MNDRHAAINQYHTKGGCLLATVTEGPFAGESILLCGEKVVYQDESARFLPPHCSTLAETTDSGLLTIEGHRVFAERFGSLPRLVVCGAGTVGLALISLCRSLEFTVTALEDRPEYAEAARQTGADEVICLPFTEGLEQITGTDSTFFVVVTREHRFDAACLRSILQKPYAYAGMMGSRKRVGLLKEQLAQEGIDKNLLDSLHAPIGLSIGAETPEEIAVSILAELIACKNRQKRTEGFRHELLDVLMSGERPCVLTEIVERIGSTPRGIGTKMLVFEDGTRLGTIGGGWMEADVIREAVNLLRSEEKTMLYHAEMKTTGDNGASPMLCGGSQLVLLEKIV